MVHSRKLPSKKVYLRPPEEDAPLDGAPAMRFRLTYDGLLRPTQRDPIGQQINTLAKHKHEVRREFHKQLKYLWSQDEFLRKHRVTKTFWRENHLAANVINYAGPGSADMIPLSEYVASQHHEHGYRWVPLVRKEFSLLCNLDILFIRHDVPGSAIQAGDLDNRIKTLIDCLRKPEAANELHGNETPGEDEDPFYCLMESDRLVTGFAVETDRSLKPPMHPNQTNGDVQLVITVELKPYLPTKLNIGFL